MIQLKIWLLLADVYLAIEQPHEAMFCVQEASQIYPLSHHIMYMVKKIFYFIVYLNANENVFYFATAWSNSYLSITME